MNQAVTVSDTIKIQNELFDIQGQIEELEGRLRYLHDQADMSTITMLLAPAGGRAPPPRTGDGDRKRPSSQLAARHRRRHRRDRRRRRGDPIALLALVTLLAAWRVWPPFRRRIAAAGAKPDPSAAD